MRIDTTKLSFLQNKSVFLQSNSDRMQKNKENDLNQKLQQIINTNNQNIQEDPEMEIIKKRASQAVCDAYIQEVSEEQKRLMGLTEEELKWIYGNLKDAQVEISNYSMLIEKFQDKLNEFDKAIDMFQNVLDEKLELPKEYTMDMVKDILNTTKELREKHIEEEGGNLEVQGILISARIAISSGGLLAGGMDIGFQKEGEKSILFNSGAEDIYKELDRVTKNLNSISENVNRLLKLIEDEMEERGIKPENLLQEQDYFQKQSKKSILYEYATYNQYRQKNFYMNN